MMKLSGGPFHRKIQLRPDLLLEVDIRVVRESRDYPEGIRYRCYPGKPHHRHVRGQEETYRFTTPEQLWDDFVQDVEAVLRGEL